MLSTATAGPLLSTAKQKPETANTIRLGFLLVVIIDLLVLMSTHMSILDGLLGLPPVIPP